MDAIVGVWLTSLLGATAFSAAGYILGQRGVFVPFLGLEPPSQPQPSRTSPDVHSIPTPPIGLARSELLGVTKSAVSKPPPKDTEVPLTLPIPPAPSQRPKSISVIPREEPDDEGRSTLVPDTQTQAAVVAAAAPTIPPPRAPSIPIGSMKGDAASAELKSAREKAEAAEQRARTAEALKVELERQIAALRKELGNETVARASATARADELADRLASASEEAASLRHKLSVLDKQTKQLREALQGRVRALTASEWHRRRDLEEAEEMRLKLRDVYERLERSSLPPTGTSVPPASASLPPSRTSSASKITAPGMPAVRVPDEDETASLRAQIERLTKENRDLRERALGSMPPKRADAPIPEEIDVADYRELLGRVESVAGLKGVALADETGSLLLGSGDHAEGMAAFGAYIRDAGARTDRLLPLEGVEEVEIRDRNGTLLSTRVVPHPSTDLCLVLLGSGDASLVAAKKIVDDHLRLRQA